MTSGGWRPEGWSLPDGWPIANPGASFEDAQAEIERCGLGDGLPVVPPTAERLDRMLAGIPDPGRSLGTVPPLFGDLTPAALAYVCVMAGCVPDDLPVVASALLATLEPDFNLLGVQTTTGSATVAVVVHGPVAAGLGLNAGTNCAGPGRRANACIGRALRLALVDIGGAHPGIGDMATLGQPGKYTFCFADQGGRPGFPSLHVARGLSPEEGAVTVLAPSGTIEVLPAGDGDTPAAIAVPLAHAMLSASVAAAGCLRRSPGEQIFVLPPEIADLLHARGCAARELKGMIAQALQDASATGPVPDGLWNPFGHAGELEPDILPIVAGGPGVKMMVLPTWNGGSRSVTRELHRF